MSKKVRFRLKEVGTGEVTEGSVDIPDGEWLVPSMRLAHEGAFYGRRLTTF